MLRDFAGYSKVRFGLPLYFLSIVGCAYSAMSQGNSDFACAKVAPSAVYSPAYARVGASNVCEGYYEKNVSRPFIELVSLTSQAPKSLEAITEANLMLSTPLVGNASISLLIQPLSVAIPYRVDALFDASSVLAWDSTHLRQATHSSLRAIGFIATVASTGPNIIVAPVTVSAAGTPGSEKPKTAFATVRVSVNASQLQWRSYPTRHSDPPTTMAWNSTGSGAIYPEEWATVSIPLPQDGREVTVEFKAVDANHSAFRPLRFAIGGMSSAGT